MNDMTFLFFISLFIASPGSATPVERSQAHIIARQDSRGGASGFSPSIWIPIVVVVLILIGLVLLSWSNNKLRRLILPGNAQSQSQPTPELTAEQLAGTINTGAANANTNAPQPAARTRRTRRPRRTPSQMSVTSLPAYNKEPGEQELVIFRGQDMEDVTVPTTVITEEDGDSSLHSGEQSRRAYSPLPNESPNESPVTQNEGQPPSRRNSRRSSRNHDLPHSSEESRGLMQNEHPHDENLPHHREEAPPYFEVVDPEESPNAPPTSASSPPSSAEPSAASNLSPPPSSPERRSGIRTFFNRMSTVGAPRALGHARGDSNLSSMSSNQSHGEPSSSASPSASRHRPSPSTASSFFRTLSRQRSQSTLHSANASARLNSPSLISLNSISAPLTHTLTRTEFTYPKSGPTAEQIKVIASRESIARFGVPYGPDAVAFASTSMLDVTQPPPDFDSVLGPGSSSLSLNASRVSLHTRGDSSGSRPMSPLAQQAVTSSDENEGARDNYHRTSLSSNAAHPLAVLNSSETNEASSSVTAESQQNETLGSLAGHPSVASKASTTYKSIVPSAPSVSEFGKLNAPPSSFNYDQTAVSSRSESRASVYSRQSYATAAESITTRGQASETDSEEDDDAPVNQTTSTHTSKTQMPPGLGTTSSRHTQEATDATVVGNTAMSGAASTNLSS